jgi:hypothetical protein
LAALAVVVLEPQIKQVQQLVRVAMVPRILAVVEVLKQTPPAVKTAATVEVV